MVVLLCLDIFVDNAFLPVVTVGMTSVTLTGGIDLAGRRPVLASMLINFRLTLR
ncbi:hypothetical protein AB0J86_04265 [Micromonospora sp. NPDC049559]|uniref:hypothetical protein n=1 Tax=Micromonospora sp. NPDC049559 TaxID=3155923 RepID=UPI00342ADF60